MGKITRNELSSGLKSELDKSGILTELETSNKTNLVVAVNEVKEDLETHKAEYVSFKEKRRWEKIVNIVCENDIAQIDFEGLSGYKEIRLLIEGNTTGATNRGFYLNFNNDVSNSYSAGLSGTNQAKIDNTPKCFAPESVGKSFINVLISNQNTPHFVYYDGRWGTSLTNISMPATANQGKWYSTSKINKISLAIESDLIKVGSVFTLWGVK